MTLVFSKKGGFTLIELLVVVSIIGLLASVVLASLSTAREQSRDGVRRADMAQIRTALELYYSDHGHYPCQVASNAPHGEPGDHLSANTSDEGKIGVGNTIDTILEPYMAGNVPNDPLDNGSQDYFNQAYFYYYDGQHSNSGGNGIGGRGAAVLGFNKAETIPRAELRRDTTEGGEGGIGSGGDFNIVIGADCASR